MSVVEIDKDAVKLSLSKPLSRIRIADIDGNHVAKPTAAKIESRYYVEWMISNAEINQLIKCYFDGEERRKVSKRLEEVSEFFWESQYASRNARKGKQVGKLSGFTVFQYEEDFFSFEKTSETDIRIRVTFKRGDYALAPHLFILLPFSNNLLKIFNRQGEIGMGEMIGSGGYVTWKPKTTVISEIIEALAHASKKHRDDLLKMTRVDN